MLTRPIKRLKTARQPTCYCAVHRDGSSWWIEYWRVRDGVPGLRVRINETDSHFLWLALARMARPGETWWVFGWHQYATLCWLGLYDRVRSGRASLPGAQSSLVDGQRTGGGKCGWGYLVTDNTPTIVDVQVRDGGRLRWVDLANYCLYPSHLLDDGEVESIDTVVQAVQDYSTLVKELDMGSFRATAAAQGWARFRTHDMAVRLIPTADPEVRKLERSAYYGGRCEAYRLGQLPGKVYHLDVTAMYSAIGQVCALPVMCESYLPALSGAELGSMADVWNCIADVDIRAVSPSWPLRLDGRVIYPVGEYRTTLCGPELMLAMRGNAIVKVHRAAWYRMDKVWDRFADWYLSSRRQLSTLGLSHMMPVLKAIANGTYGKIGARGVQWSATEYPHKKVDWGQWYGSHPTQGDLTLFRAIDGQVSYRDQSHEPDMAMPSISAWHTSYGRMQLGLIMLQAGQHNVHYCDTDGVMVNQDGYDRLKAVNMIGDGDPGRLSIREVGDDVEIWGIKHYRFGDRVCCAGIDSWEHGEHDGHTVAVKDEPFEAGLARGRPLQGGQDINRRSRTAPYRHGHRRPDGVVEPYVVGSTYSEVTDGSGVIRRERTTAIVGCRGHAAEQLAADGDLQAVQPASPGGGHQGAVSP